MLGAAIGGIGQWVIDQTVEGEEEKRAAKAAMWASIAGAAAATGIDSASAAVGVVMAAKEATAAGLKEGSFGQRLLDASGQVAATAVGGGAIQAAQLAGGAAVGAGVGYAAEGEAGVLTGMTAGANVAKGDLGQLASRTTAAAAGAGVAAATANEDDRFDAAIFGATVGATADASAQGALCASEAGAQAKALGTLGAEAASIGAGLAYDALAKNDSDGSRLESLRMFRGAVSGVFGAASASAGAAASGSAADALDAAGSLGAVVVQADAIAEDARSGRRLRKMATSAHRDEAAIADGQRAAEQRQNRRALASNASALSSALGAHVRA